MKQFRQRLLCRCLAHGAAPLQGWTTSFGEQLWENAGAAHGESCPGVVGRGPCNDGGPSAFLLDFPVWPWLTLLLSLRPYHCWMVETTTKATVAACLTLQTWSMRSPLLIFSQLTVSASADCSLSMLMGPHSQCCTADAPLPCPPCCLLLPFLLHSTRVSVSHLPFLRARFLSSVTSFLVQE